MHLHPEALPQKSENPAENQNEKSMVQAALMMRYPEGDFEWSKRYTRVFRELFNEDKFHGLVKEAHHEKDAARRNDLLTRIQERLDEQLAEDPTKVDEYPDPQV